MLSPVTRRAVRWGALYILLALVPLGIGLLQRPGEVRGFGVELGALLGLLALGVFAMQLVISGRHPWFAGRLGFDNVLQFHRQVGLFALLLVIIHPAVLMSADPALLAYLDPREDTLRALALLALLAAAVTLVVSSLWRVQFGLPYEWWRLLHGALAAFLVVGGLGHALMAAHYTGGAITAVMVTGVLAVPLGLLLDSRVLRPLRMQRRPWRVVENQSARGDATTLTLEPEGDHALTFQPGQFIWVTLGQSPWSLQQHPFSLVSSAMEPRRIAFTAKHLGDFTNQLPAIEPGTPAWIEGPYGAFTPDRKNASGAVLMAGGIGITPIMSILRTFRDEGNRLPLWLVYANAQWDEATFREELAELEQQLDLEVIHVVEQPPDGWSGESGFVDDDLITRRLPPDNGRRQYFVCGPDPMMNAAEGALLRQGVAPTRVVSDRFDLV